MLKTRLLQQAGGEDKLYVDDVFSTYLYTGSGSAKTITNGIDLAGKGGLVWIKNRTTGSRDNILTDTTRGATKTIYSNANLSEQTVSTALTAFTSSGFSIGSSSDVNESAGNIGSMTFRISPKFFDIVTYTGNGSNRTIAHNLGQGQEVGCIFIKRTDATSDWQVYHRSLANTEYLVLNSTAAKVTGATRWNSTTATASVFSIGTDASVNASGGIYVAYVFAHDSSADGIIQCGSFTTDGNGDATVNIGWEPQWLLDKPTDAASHWELFDTARGLTAAGGGNDARLRVNLSNAEDGSKHFSPTATGFSVSYGSGPNTHIYLAIRRPNKPPTTGTQVYNAIVRTGTGTTATVTGVGLAPDLVINRNRTPGSAVWFDKLRGPTIRLASTIPNAEASDSGVTSFGMDGFSLGSGSNSNLSSVSFANWCFKRYPGVFDVVCYTADGSYADLVYHNLGVKPELIFTKARSATTDWEVTCLKDNTIPTYYTAASDGTLFSLNTTNAATTDFTLVGDESSYDPFSAFWGQSEGGTQYVAYLFATKAGISKVGTYTGNGSSQTINCNFTTGARFIIIKRTDSTGDWYVWDTSRGVVSGNDPHLSLNTTVAEVTTDDSIDPDTSGFIVNQVAATNVNVNAATYIYLAFA